MLLKGPKKKQPTAQAADPRGSYKRGGRVKKTSVAKLHKGERVLTKRQAKRFRGKR
jgi:hypothetical protein